MSVTWQNDFWDRVDTQIPSCLVSILLSVSVWNIAKDPTMIDLQSKNQTWKSFINEWVDLSAIWTDQYWCLCFVTICWRMEAERRRRDRTKIPSVPEDTDVDDDNVERNPEIFDDHKHTTSIAATAGNWVSIVNMIIKYLELFYLLWPSRLCFLAIFPTGKPRMSFSSSSERTPMCSRALHTPLNQTTR